MTRGPNKESTVPATLDKEEPGFGLKDHGDSSFRVFYVVAPDGLCYWFGER